MQRIQILRWSPAEINIECFRRDAEMAGRESSAAGQVQDLRGGRERDGHFTAPAFGDSRARAAGPAEPVPHRVAGISSSGLGHDAGCGNIHVLDVSMRSKCAFIIFIFGGFAGNRLDSLGAPLLLDILGCAGTPLLIWRPRSASASRGS